MIASITVKDGTAVSIKALNPGTTIITTKCGEFENYSFLPMTEEMHKIIEHWKEQKLEFDAIYVGYIGTVEQIDTVCDFIDYFCANID